MVQSQAGRNIVGGRETLGSIEKSIADLRAREAAIQSEMEAGNRERTKLLEGRVGAFRDLAELRVTTALADGVIDAADQLSAQVSPMLDARQKTITALKRRAEKVVREREKLAKAHAELAASIAERETELDRLAIQARADLQAAGEQAQRFQSVEALREMHEKALEKAQTAEADRRTKGEPYENDPLFIYLWRRDYGGRDYRPSRIIRWLDGKVAALIGWSNARANYSMLLEIPKRLSEHAERLKARLDAAEGQIEDAVAQRLRELAGADLPAALAAERERHAKENKAIDKLAAEETEITTQLNIYASGTDPAFTRIIELEGDFLEGKDMDRLRELARQTHSPADDQIVQRIGLFKDKIDTLTRRMDRLREDLREVARRRDEMVRAAAEFRRSGYDDPGSVFTNGSGMEQLLQELLKGLITGAEYWARSQKNHRWRSRPADSYRRGTSWPSSGPFPRAPKSGSPRRGPDFRTGGRF